MLIVLAGYSCQPNIKFGARCSENLSAPYFIIFCNVNVGVIFEFAD
jgi:hypothetical protein